MYSRSTIALVQIAWSTVPGCQLSEKDNSGPKRQSEGNDSTFFGKKTCQFTYKLVGQVGSHGFTFIA